jgi:plastocyanin
MRIRALLIVIVVAAALGPVLVRGGFPDAAGGATAAPATVKLGEFFFKPRILTVRVGQSVRFLNVGKIAHTVADADAKGDLRSKLIRPRPLAHGQSQVVRFSKPGTVFYVCTFHPTLMRGRLIVVR